MSDAVLPPEIATGDPPLRRLRWVAASGVLADALGVTEERSELFELTVVRVVNDGGGIRACLDAIEQLPDVTLEELVSAVFALGYFDGANDG